MDVPDPATFDVFSTWWGRLGLAGVFGVLLVLLVRWVILRMGKTETKLERRISERDERDKAEREAMTKRLRELEESRFQEMKNTTQAVTKALESCATASVNNDRSRRKLDITLRSLVITMNNLPCNRLAPPATGATRGTFTTPLPEDTPAEGTELSTDETQPLDPVTDRVHRAVPGRVQPDQQRRPQGG